MQVTSGIKKKLLTGLALTIINNQILEKAFCYLCSNSFIRNNLKLTAIAYSYLSILDRLEARVANMKGYKLWVNISEYLGVVLYFFKEHNEPFSAFLVSKLINKGDICVDVGANMGSYTFLIASRVGTEGKVIAFEPNMELYKMLISSIQLNHYGAFVVADSRALYSESGESLEFYLSENLNNSGTSSLVYHGVFLNRNNFVQVSTITLDDYFKEVQLEKCNLLKIDVERAELAVLQGMGVILKNKRVDYIVLEQFSNSESQELICSFDYTCWLIDEGKKLLVNCDQVEGGQFGNYLFISPHCADDFKKKYASFLSTNFDKN